MYIHELQDWPRFRWSPGELAETLASVRHRQGRLIGHMEALGFNLRQEAVLQTLTGDVVQSSEIEGETLDAEQVRLAIARRPWPSRARRAARNGSTACRRGSGRSAGPTTTSWSRHRRERWTLRPGVESGILVRNLQGGAAPAILSRWNRT